MCFQNKIGSGGSPPPHKRASPTDSMDKTAPRREAGHLTFGAINKIYNYFLLCVSAKRKMPAGDFPAGQLMCV